MPAKRFRKVYQEESWSTLVKDYLRFKKATGLRDSTLEGQKMILNTFFKRHPEALQNPKDAVYAFLSEDIMPATYNMRVSYLRSFFNWGMEEGIFSENPAAKLKKRKAEGRVVHLDEDTLAALLRLPDLSTMAGLRDYALILLTLDTGIRPKEAFSLLVDDVNLRTLDIHIRPEVAKDKDYRSLPILPATAKAIRKWIQNRPPEWEEVPLFCTTEGTPMNRQNWANRLEKYGKELGVRIRPYDLRHAFAVQYLRNGGHAFALQKTLGHSTMDMTKHYVHLAEGDLRDQHEIASPIKKIIPQKKRVRKLKND